MDQHLGTIFLGMNPPERSFSKLGLALGWSRTPLPLALPASRLGVQLLIVNNSFVTTSVCQVRMLGGGWNEQVAQARPLEWGSFGWQSARGSGELLNTTGNDETKLHSKTSLVLSWF